MARHTTCANSFRPVRDQREQLLTQRFDARFQGMVKHAGQHDHAAHPLAGAAEFGMLELRHAAAEQGIQHVRYRVIAETVSPRHIADIVTQSLPNIICRKIGVAID